MKKIILVTDYVGWGAQVFFYSTFSNGDDVPNGNSNKRRDFLSYSDSRTVVEDVFSGDLSHITTNDGYGGPLIIYHQYYAIAKHTSPEPVKGSWGQQENVIPEFPSLLVPGLFMMTTLIIVIAYKRKTPFHFARYE